jgi:hypothetical protein
LAAVVVVAGLGLAGCSDAPVVGDGSLGSGWALLPTPSVPVPTEAVCTAAASAGSHTVAWTLSFMPGTPVDCAASHLTETYHVGAFPADVDTDPTTVPSPGTARFRSAYVECVREAGEFLGGDPLTSRVAVVPVLPSDRQWAGQARWFRCELLELAGLDRTIAARTGSLRDALVGDGPLTTTCADVTLAGAPRVAVSVIFVPCARLHDAELTGAYTLPDGEYPGAGGGLTNEGCQTVSARYIGISVEELLRAGSETYAFGAGPTEEEWRAGVRSAWCFYGGLEQRRTGSIKSLNRFPYP